MGERRESEDLKLACLLPWPACFSDRSDQQVARECLLESGLQSQDEWGGRLEEEICLIYWRWGQRGRGGPRRCCYRAGVSLEDLIWRRKRDEDLQLACLPPCPAPTSVWLAHFKDEISILI